MPRKMRMSSQASRRFMYDTLYYRFYVVMRNL
jgi:hypothetical protein